MDLNEKEIKLAGEAIEAGRALGVMVSAASVTGNDGLADLLAKSVMGDEWSGGVSAAAESVAEITEEFTYRLREANSSNLDAVVQMLMLSLIGGILDGNDDIETVTGSPRFQKQCPDSGGCGSCTGC